LVSQIDNDGKSFSSSPPHANSPGEYHLNGHGCAAMFNDVLSTMDGKDVGNEFWFSVQKAK
jgi:hypothetical protein